MSPALLLLLAVLSLSSVSPIFANPQDQVGGSFFFYDHKLDAEPDDPDDDSGKGQAKMVECQGKSEVIEWGQAPNLAHCLTFTPNKVGDSISFQIHIAKVVMPETHDYKVTTAEAGFGNEGIYQLLVNDQPAGPEHDATRNDGWIHGNFSFVPGDYKITYRYVGPSPKGGGKSVNLMRFEIY